MQLTFGFLASVGISVAAATLGGAQNSVTERNIHVTKVSLSPGCEAINRQAFSLLQQNRSAQAETQLSEFLARLNHSPENTLCFGVTLNNLAYALTDLGKRSDAENAAQRSVESLESSLGTASPWLCRPLLLLGGFSLQTGKLTHAAALLSRVEALPLSAHDDLAIVKGLRADFLQRSQDLRHAAGAYRESIAEWEKAGEGNSPKIVPELLHLALLYGKEGDITQALAILERAWRIVDSALGDANSRLRVLPPDTFNKLGAPALQNATVYIDQRNKRIQLVTS